MSEESIARKVGKKVAKHKKKVGLFSVGTVIFALQAFHALAPMVCSLPWVHDQMACLDVAAKAKAAANQLHALDGMTLDDGSPFLVETITNDEGSAP
jgi:hypothetical protein